MFPTFANQTLSIRHKDLIDRLDHVTGKKILKCIKYFKDTSIFKVFDSLCFRPTDSQLILT